MVVVGAENHTMLVIYVVGTEQQRNERKLYISVFV